MFWGCYRNLTRLLRRNKTLWRATLLWLCALVFFFALHAKLAVDFLEAPPGVAQEREGVAHEELRRRHQEGR